MEDYSHEVNALVSNNNGAKELGKRIQLLMQGTSLTKQERECKLYDEFDKFAYKKGESLHEFYLRFSLLLNDMNIYNMKLEQFQVNTKTSFPPYQPFSPPSDYTSGAPPTSLIISPPLSPIKINSNENCLLTPKKTPPPLTTPPPAPTQPSKLASPVVINLDPIKLLFSTPLSSPSLFDVLGDLPPSTTIPSPPRPSFATIEWLANEPPPIPPINSTVPLPTLKIEPTPPPLPSHYLPPPPSQLPPLPPLGPNNPLPLLTHEMYYEYCQRTQEKVLIITTLKDELRKLKGKDLANNEVTRHPSDPDINTELITPKLLNKRSSHSAYIKHTQEKVIVLRDLVDNIKANYPLDLTIESALAVTPMNKVKRVRFTEPVTSSRNTITKKASTSNLASNKPMLSSTGVKPSTSASGSQPSGNTKKDKTLQTQSSTQINKVEAHPRKVKSSLKNKDHLVAPKGTAHVQHSKLNANSELKCVKCNGCMLSDNHNLCVLDYINNVNARAKSKSAKKQTKRKVWKPTRKMFTTIGYIWRPTGQTLTTVNLCGLSELIMCLMSF
ncbi:hypothetical protein Tco_0530380 [Tanacetum coccineum]